MSRGSKSKLAVASGDGGGADEKHHKYRCRELKRQLGELEEYNEALAIRLLRSQKRLRRMKIERNVLLDRFERTQHYAANHRHHDDDDDSASDSDAPLKDTFPRPPLSDVDANDQQSLYLPTSAGTTASTASGRGRRKNQPNALNIHQSSTSSTPRQQSISGGINAEPSTPASTATPARKPRAEKDPRAPKRPANAFVMFCQSERPNIKSAGTDMTSGELTRAMSTKWKSLPKAEKQKFYDVYEREMTRYQQELALYKEGAAPPTPTSDSTAPKSADTQSTTTATAAVNDHNGSALSADRPQPASTSSSASSASEAVSENAADISAAAPPRAYDSAETKNDEMDVDASSDGSDSASASQRNSSRSPKEETAEPRTIPADTSNGNNYNGVSSSPPSSPLQSPSLRNGVIVESPTQQKPQTNGKPTHDSSAAELKVATTTDAKGSLEEDHMADESTTNLSSGTAVSKQHTDDERLLSGARSSTKEIEDGMRSTALGETPTTPQQQSQQQLSSSSTTNSSQFGSAGSAVSASNTAKVAGQT
ncbi:non-histone protein [Coemansia sp. RSA 1200]|nr:non-histone protein [Coemansia sp. RSA 1200]